jgi:hypothetical protein
VVGAPIPNAGPIADPTEEQIEQLHRRYIERVHDLYEEHKQEAGYGDIPIVFVH